MSSRVENRLGEGPWRIAGIFKAPDGRHCVCGSRIVNCVVVRTENPEVGRDRCEAVIGTDCFAHYMPDAKPPNWATVFSNFETLFASAERNCTPALADVDCFVRPALLDFARDIGVISDADHAWYAGHTASKASRTNSRVWGDILRCSMWNRVRAQGIHLRILHAFRDETPRCLCPGGPPARFVLKFLGRQAAWACGQWRHDVGGGCNMWTDVEDFRDPRGVLPAHVTDAAQTEVPLTHATTLVDDLECRAARYRECYCKCGPPELMRVREGPRGVFLGCARWTKAGGGCGATQALPLRDRGRYSGRRH